MSLDSTISRIAAEAGIAESYTSAWGDTAHVSEETQRKLLDALGYDTRNDESLIESAKKKQRRDVLAPVCVIRKDKPKHISMSLGASARVSDFSWSLKTEGGELLQGWLESQLVSDSRTEDGTLVFALPDDLPLGYHTLVMNRKRRKSPFEMTLIITPTACFKQPALDQGKKMWGPSVQLYTLKTPHNWGMGDFGDLKQLVCNIANRGGDFVGLNPIHSLFPANPEAASPYSPSSRRWLNILYIDVSSVPEFAQSDDAQQLVGSDEFQNRLSEARETQWVNYSEVACLKMAVLPLLYKCFKSRHLDKNSSRAQAFGRFVERGGESLLHQAAFDALHASLKAEDDSIWGWPVFPEKYRHFSKTDVKRFIKDNADQVELYMYLQWVAEGQLAEVQSLAEEKGMSMGLYRDLAVGVCDSGSDTWADEGSLCQKASIGAPPDILGPLGQNWGLPPFNPEHLQTSAYKPFIELLRANMKHCGALRIDHVLGLLRLWWVPKGDSAKEGAYIYNEVNDLLSILALESHRFQCSVIGEDLGTVPDEIVTLLSEAGVHSYKVFFFETAKDGGFYSPEHYTEQSMAALCTHDMPTLRGFWHCEDLKLGEQLGLYPDAQELETLFDSRAENKQRLLDSLDGHGNLPEGVGRDASFVPMDRYLSEAMQYHLASGSSALLSLQLEDWLEMDKPVNIPGTVDEYPNWRRKLSVTLDELFADENINALTSRLTETRAKASRSKS